MRVSEIGEILGLDEDQHGEFAVSALFLRSPDSLTDVIMQIFQYDFVHLERDLENPQEHRDLVEAHFGKDGSTHSYDKDASEKTLDANGAGPVRAAVETTSV